MIEPISLATVEQLNGTIEYLEIRQGPNVIKVSLEAHGLAKQNKTWKELRESVDRLSDNIQAKLLNDIERNKAKRES